MNIEDESLIKKLAPIMKTTVKDLLPDYNAGISASSTNGISQCVWARRNDMLQEIFSEDKEVSVITFNRGLNFEISCILSKKTGILYVLINENNLRRNVIKVNKEGLSKHYFYILLFKNSIKMEDVQLSIFNESDSVPNEYRPRTCLELLKSNYENVEKVEFVSGQYINDELVRVELDLFDGNFDLIKKDDITGLFINQYTFEEDMDETIDNITNPLITMKSNIKKLKNDDNSENVRLKKLNDNKINKKTRVIFHRKKG